jgi:hypothetical protein
VAPVVRIGDRHRPNALAIMVVISIIKYT